MNYTIEFKNEALKFMEKQNRKTRERLWNAVMKLPYEGDITPLSGRKGYYRLRVGSFRVIYRIDEGNRIVIITAVGNRGQVYKGA